MKLHSLVATAALLGLLVWIGGCGSKGDDFQEYGQAPERPAAGGHDHDHAHAHGPNGGHLIELGDEEYHAELVFDEKTRATKLFILGPDAKTPVAIAAEGLTLHLDIGEKHTHLELVPAPAEGDPEGKSSCFAIAGEAVPAELDSEEKFEGHFDVEINGKPYEGEITHGAGHAHDHTDHDHAKPAGEKQP
jgi:hypothetical protein